jgi:hypothetical protein
MQSENEKQSKLKLLDRSSNSTDLQSAIDKLLKLITEDNMIDNSKGKLVISEFLDILMDKQDPFITALATLGNEKSVNALGILLFITFQLGYNFGAKDLSFDTPSPEELVEVTFPFKTPESSDSE